MIFKSERALITDLIVHLGSLKIGSIKISNLLSSEDHYRINYRIKYRINYTFELCPKVTFLCMGLVYFLVECLTTYFRWYRIEFETLPKKR